MYRIRRLTGGEVNLASLDELAAAIAAGTVTADAEIYHQRADRWLPIANHPHFRIAKDRSQSPARKPTPVPAPASQAPALRLVRSDMTAAPEARPAARWTPPQRPMVPTPRPSMGAAAPAVEPPATVIEFVAEKPAEPPTPPPAEPVRPKRIEPATAGLPLLDVELPPRATRQPTPMPSPAKPQLPLALPEPVQKPIGGRQPTPMPSPASWPSMGSAVRTAPKPEHAPPPVRLPTPMPSAVIAAPPPVDEPVAPLAPVEVHRPTPMPWQRAVEEPSLDVPPPVRDFSVVESVVDPSVEPIDAVEPALAGAAPSGRSRSLWPMVAGAMVVAAIAAFLALRPRGEVESLEPRPVAAKPAASAPATRPVADVAEGYTRPQITPIVPPGPSPEIETSAAKPPSDGVVPAAPRLSEAVPASALGNIGSLGVDVDPTAAARQKGLEATRKQIESQLQP